MELNTRLLTEKKLIANLLVDNGGYLKNKSKLNSNLFCDLFHKAVFEEFAKCIKNGNTPDSFTIANNLPENKFPDALEKITEIEISCDYSTDIPNLIIILATEEFKKAAKTLAQDLLYGIANKGLDKNGVFDILNNFLKNQSATDTTQVTHIKEVLSEIMTDIGKRLDPNHEPAAVQSGFEQLDNFTFGLHNGDLIIIAGETSQGKTSFGLSITKNAAFLTNKKILFISLEMSDKQLVGRILGSKANVSSKRLLFNPLSESELDRVEKVVDTVANTNIFLTRKSALSISEILSLVYSHKAQHGLDLVIVDYLQLVRGGKNINREQEVGGIARELKNLAVGADIPVIALSQFARDKANPMPSLSRLRDSGQIEEAADLVLLVWRPEFYRLPSIELQNGEVLQSNGKGHVIVAKGRSYGTTDFAVGWDCETTTFFNIDNTLFRPQSGEAIKSGNAFDDLNNQDTPY